jgi:hypothetical protein
MHVSCICCGRFKGFLSINPKMLYSEDRKQKPAFLHKPIKNILANLRKGTEEQENKESNRITLENVSM